MAALEVVLESRKDGRRSRTAVVVAVVIAALALFGLGFEAWAQDAESAAGEAPAPLVTLEAIEVDPSAPGADTLCKLKVKLKNGGSEIASQLGFRVSLNGQDLLVYGNQLFMYPVEPGQEAVLPLYNFWTTESSRPMPADGKFVLEIALTEAQWMARTDEEGVETWRPLGAVEGLPSSMTITLGASGAAE